MRERTWQQVYTLKMHPTFVYKLHQWCRRRCPLVYGAPQSRAHLRLLSLCLPSLPVSVLNRNRVARVFYLSKKKRFRVNCFVFFADGAKGGNAFVTQLAVLSLQLCR